MTIGNLIAGSILLAMAVNIILYAIKRGNPFNSKQNITFWMVSIIFCGIVWVILLNVSLMFIIQYFWNTLIILN